MKERNEQIALFSFTAMEYSRYKFMVQVVIGERREQGVRC